MSEFIYRGTLGSDPLPEVLYKIFNYKVPGVLTVSAFGGQKQVFISGGEIIFASSSFDEDRLGEFLMAQGRISQTQYDQSVLLMKGRGVRQGTALVALGVLTGPQLYEAVKDQVVSIVWSCFNWADGEMTFEVGHFKEDEIIKLSLDTRDAILQGIRKIKDPKRVVRWLGRKEDVFEPSETAMSLLPHLPLTKEDKQVLRLVDGVRTFLEVLQASALDSTLTAKGLYALYVLGLIKKKTTSPIKIVTSTSGA